MYTFFLSCVSAVICAYLTRHFFDFRSAHLKRACACRTAAALTCKPPFFIVLIVVSLFCYYITLTAVLQARIINFSVAVGIRRIYLLCFRIIKYVVKSELDKVKTERRKVFLEAYFVRL